MYRINKPVLNSPTGLYLSITYTRFSCAQSLINDKTNDPVTFYFHVLNIYGRPVG